MEQLFYFAYGSNMLRARLEQRVGKIPPENTYTLHDYRLVFNAGFGYANIEPFPGERVYGVLYQLTDLQVGSLDFHEGYPRAYGKFYMIDNGRIIYGYVCTNKYYISNTTPTRPYLNLCIDGALEHGLLETYNSLVGMKETLFPNVKSRHKKKLKF